MIDFRYTDRLKYCLVLFMLYLRAMAEVDPIVIEGSRFFYQTNGTQFYIRGIVYHSAGSGASQAEQLVDPLEDGAICRRDIPYLLSLNVNTIWTYYLSPENDHKECMDAFAAVGIYVFAYLGTADAEFEFIDPRWDRRTMAQFTGIIDSMSKYTNVIGFSVGASLGMEDDVRAAFYKAAVRDVKRHIRDSNYRQIPVGWTTTGVYSGPDAVAQLDFMSCGEERADWLGLAFTVLDQNGCAPDARMPPAAQLYSNSSIPVFISSVGCKVNTTELSRFDSRQFETVSASFMQNSTTNLNGAIVYAFFQNIRSYNNFGIVDVANGGKDLAPMKGYYALSSVMATITPTLTNSASYTPRATPPSTCATSNPNPQIWNSSSVLPPKPNQQVCECMMQTLRCVAKPDAVESMVAQIFAQTIPLICEGDVDGNCIGIAGNTTTGKYGAYSYCNRTEVYSYAANEHWQRNGDSSCNLNNTVELRPEPPANSTSQDCTFLLNQAGSEGQNIVTAFPTPTELPPPTSAPAQSSGLSAGGKAGIGVGVTAFAALFLAGIFLLLRRRRRNASPNSSTAELDAGTTPWPMEKHHSSDVYAELPGQQRHELPGSKCHDHEMDGGQGMTAEAPVAGGFMPPLNLSPAELPGAWLATPRSSVADYGSDRKSDVMSETYK